MAQQQDQQQLIEIIQQQEQLLQPLQPSRVVLGVDLDKINKPDYSDAKVVHHKEQFDQWLLENYEKTNTSFVLKKKDYDEIRDNLTGVTPITDAQKRYVFKQKKYSLNSDGALCREIDNIIKQVVYLEQFFDVIYELHCIQRIHQGIKKTFDQVILRYVGITREIVAQFRKFCYVCDLKTSQRTQERLLPIKSNEVFERTQIDMIDMRNQPDGEYVWICHVVDHNTNFHAAWPQKSKEGIK
jgi:hypothetical protein